MHAADTRNCSLFAGMSNADITSLMTLLRGSAELVEVSDQTAYTLNIVGKSWSRKWSVSGNIAIRRVLAGNKSLLFFALCKKPPTPPSPYLPVHPSVTPCLLPSFAEILVRSCSGGSAGLCRNNDEHLREPGNFQFPRDICNIFRGN